ncbi:MAG: hypothetical protein V1754_07565 [Pseudomonadota bacterium]
MGMPIGTEIRLSYLLPPERSGALLLDLSKAGSVGALPGLEKLEDRLPQLCREFDGLILNPGPAEKFANYLGGKRTSAPLVRADWTNAYRPKDFAMNLQKIKWVTISDVQDVLALGASGAIVSLLMGFDDQFEAENIETISRLARACYGLSLPIAVEICPIGPKITDVNFDGSVKLGVSCMMEAGADMLIVPTTTDETRELLGKWPAVPVLEKMEKIPSAKEVEHLLAFGYRGVVLTEAVLEEKLHVDRLTELQLALRANENALPKSKTQ